MTDTPSAIFIEFNKYQRYLAARVCAVARATTPVLKASLLLGPKEGSELVRLWKATVPPNCNPCRSEPQIYYKVPLVFMPIKIMNIITMTTPNNASDWRIENVSISIFINPKI
ncbi:MAG TPA: hypothetical protein DFK19_01420 [Ochrobactrum sp.]|nr:hypothetical protein [Ochrobactrum sp.]